MNTPTSETRRSLHDIKTRVLARIWEVEPSECGAFHRAVHPWLRIGVMVGRDFFQNLVKLQAMALAFKTLLSLAPLLAVVFSILKGLGVHNRMEPALAEALAPLGEKGTEITAHLIGFVDRMRAGALGIVGFVALFITVMSLMATIEDAFNHIWRVKTARKLSRKFSDYLSVILVGPVLIFAAVTMTATLQSNAFVRQILTWEPFGRMALGLLRLVPYITLWGAFTFVYMFVPNTRARLNSALVGGLVAALLWQTVGWGFATFVASSTRYDAIYSSLAVLPLFLLWLYIGWVIVLLGAQVTHAHQSTRSYRRDREQLTQTLAGREKIALEILLLIGVRFYRGLPPMRMDQVAVRLEIPENAVRDLMAVFADHGLVVVLTGQESFVLSRHPETIAIKEVLDCVRRGRERRKSFRPVGNEESAVDELLSEVDQSAAAALEGKTLQHLILEAMPARP